VRWALQRSIIICDEVTSALRSDRAGKGILQLLLRLQKDNTNITYMFITHGTSPRWKGYFGRDSW